MGKDEDLFMRAMETLGVSRKRGPGPAKTGEPVKVEAPPVLPDEDLDFDAVMRSGRGPAKMMAPAKTAKKGDEAAVAHEGPSPAARTPRPDPREYRASADEAALFEAAMGSLEPAAVSARAADRTGEAKAAKARRESRSDDFERCVKRAEIEPEAVLDLHGRKREDAVKRLKAFIEEAARERWRLVAIVCGRGLHSEGGNPILKPLVGGLLGNELRGQVRRFAEAPTGLGGSGTWIAEIRLDAND